MNGQSLIPTGTFKGSHSDGHFIKIKAAVTDKRYSYMNWKLHASKTDVLRHMIDSLSHAIHAWRLCRCMSSPHTLSRHTLFVRGQNLKVKHKSMKWIEGLFGRSVNSQSHRGRVSSSGNVASFNAHERAMYVSVLFFVVFLCALFPC